MSDQSAIEQQIREYEEQLNDVEELLRQSPEDESLRALKSDLLELLNITRLQSQSSSVPQYAPPDAKVSISGDVFQKALEAAVGTSVGIEGSSSDEFSRPKRPHGNEAAINSFVKVVEEAADAAAAMNTSIVTDESYTAVHGSDGNEPAKKKAKKLKDFEVPPHLIPNEGDSEAERNKKRRAIKALKSKWREKKKEMESEKKQHSWQSFQKKKGVGKDRSIFSTNVGDDATKVGVVSISTGRQMTEFGERKRHK